MAPRLRSKNTPNNRYVHDNDEGCTQMDILKEKTKKRKFKNVDETLETSNKKSKIKKINSLPKYTEELLKNNFTSIKTPENRYVLDNDEGCAQMDILKEKPKKKKLKNNDETLETSNKKSKMKKNCTCKKTPESLYVLDNDEGCTQMDILKEKPKKNKLKNIDETLEISNKKSKVKKINSLPKNTAETLKKSCTCKRTPESLYVLDNDEGCTQMDILKEKPKKRKLKNIDETLGTSNKKSKMKKINSLPKYTEEMLKKNFTSKKTQENSYVLDNDEGCCTQMDILKEKPKKKKLKNTDETLETSNKKSKMKKINSLPKYTEEMLKKNCTSNKTQENCYVRDNDEGCAQMDILKEKPKKKKLKNIDETLGTSNKKSKMKKINSLPKYTEEMLKKKCTSKKTQENSYVLDNDEGCAQMDILKEKPKKRKLKNIDETLETSNKKSKRKEINSLPKYTEEMLKKNFASIKCTVNLGGTQICMSKLSKYKRKNITNTSIYSKQKKKKVEPCDEFHDLHSSKPSMYIGPFVDILDDRPLEVQNYTRNLRIKRLLKGKSPYEDKYKYKTSLHKLNVVLQQFLPFGIEEYIPPQSVFPSDDQIIQDLTLTELIQKRLNKLRTEGKERNLFYHQESSLKQTGNKCSWKEKCINKKKRQDFIYLRNALHKRLIYRPKLTNLTYIEQKFNLRNLLKNNYSLTMCPKKVKKYYNILHKYSLKIVSEYCKIYKVNSLLTKKFLKIAKDKTIDRRKSSKKNTDCTLLQNNGNVLQNNSNDPVSNKVFEKESISRVIKYYQKKCNKKSFDENLTKYVVVLRDLVNYNLIKTKPQVINTEYLKMIKSVYIVYKYPNILQTRIRTTGNVIKGDIHFGKCSSTCISFNTSVKVDNVNSYTDDLSIIKNKRKSNQILKYAKLKEIIKSFSIHISNSDLVIVDQILENIVKNYNSLNSDTCQINEISDFIISCKSKSFKAHSKNHIKENNIVYHVDIDDNEVCVRKNEAGKFFKFYNFSRHEKNRQKSPFSINPIDFKFKQYKSNYLTNVIKSWEIVAINMKITIRKMKLIDRNTKDGQLMLKAGILSLIKNPDDKMLLYNSNIPDNCSIQLQSCAKNVNSFNEITEQIHENSKILNKNEILNHSLTSVVETQNCHDPVKDKIILEQENDFDKNADSDPLYNSNSDEVNIEFPSNDVFVEIAYETKIDYSNNYILNSDEKLNNLTSIVETQNCQNLINDKILENENDFGKNDDSRLLYSSNSENGDDFDINDDIRPFCIPYSNEDNIQLPSSDKTTEQYNNNDILNGDEILNHNPTSIVKTQNCHDAVNDNNILENENDFGENDDSRLLYNSNPDIVDIQLASSVEFVGIPVETTEQYLNNFTSFGDEILNHNLTLIDETQNSHDPVNDNSIFEHEKEFDNNEDNISPSCISNSDKVNIQLPSNDEFVEISVETTEKHLNNDTSFGDELLNHNVTSIVEKQNFHNVFNDNKILENENDFENNHNIAALCVPNFDDDNILFPSSNVYVEIPYEKTEHYPNNKILIGGELLNHKLTLTVESQNSYNPVNDNSILEQEKDFDNNDDNISPSCISNSDKDNIQLPSSDEIIKQYHNNDILIVDEFLNHNVTSIVKTQNCHDLDNDNNILEHEINFGNNDTDSYCISNSNVDDFQFPSSDVFVEVSSETTEQHLNNDLLSGDEMLNHNFSSIVGIQNSHDAVNDNCIVVHETNSGKNDGIVSYFISNSNEGSIQFPSSDVFVEVSSETTEQHLNNDLLSGVEMLNDNSTSIVGTQNSYDPVNDNSILEHEINLGNNDDIGSLCNLNTFDDVNDNNAFKVLKTAIEVAILDGTNKINNNAINIQNDANSSVMQYNCNNIPYEIPEDIIDFEGNYSEEISEMKYLKDLIDKYNLLNNSNIQADKSKIFIYHKIFRDLKIFIDDYLTFHYNYCSFTSEVLSYYLSNTISYEDMYNIMSIVIFSDDIFSKFISLHSTLDLYELQQCGIQLPITLNDNIDNLIQILIKCFENKISHSIHDLLILYILKRLKTEIKSLTDDLKSKIVTLINKALKYVSEPDCDLKGFVEVNNDVLHLNAAIINDCFMNNNAVAHAEENVEMQVKNTDHINIDTNNVYYEIENLLDIDLIGIDILYNSIDDLEEETTDNLESILPFTFKEPANNVDSCNNPAVIDNGEGTSGTNMPMDKNKGAKSVLKVNMNVQEIPMAEKTHFLTVHLNQMLKKNAVVVQEELAKNNPDRVVSLDNMTNGFDNAGTLLP
ncbi:Hypothetical protein CINCED_3A014799 [Cinara cedri]|uniref:Uncharacterized protein n=1 Tax=Cinara cedri TaxID=506608 RepID=A0A5E4NLW6_9HEMI|nr:Hypothetical protein CINCED_3A014799 [Cinara cedri]